MEKLKKIGKVLLFPHISLVMVLLPISVCALVYSMLYLSESSLVSIASYVLSAYTLTVWCLRVPSLILFFKTLKRENKLISRWFSDIHWKAKMTLYFSFVWNMAYAVFQLVLGVYHSTFWYFSLGIYYLILAVMRFFLAEHTRKYTPGEKMRSEFKKYRFCGISLLMLNVALSLIIFFMVYWSRSFSHHPITAIAMAAYTFTAFTFAIINILKYRKYNSPLLSAAKAVSLAGASVSMLTLESTMLTAFGSLETDAFTNKIMLACTGAVVSVFIITMAIYMIVRSNKALKKREEE